ncbi:hypothetical protein BP6252_07835 [Coleophoma cylindrospora]|uniref:Large ribosomal subunit protein mL67 n=1 Tax=Coleophoma cylindrospora TaxID=1849047 RepID=A0A3D8RB57_9HELO|nr:hypothetical protein BP6252_07835 [Coleophoma cylindrospora]
MAGGHRMVARRARDAGRRAIQSAESKAAHQARLAELPPRTQAAQLPRREHGKTIYVYNHLQTNQVVYSLSEAMKNNASLKQIPFNGKKTVPAALRKDHWMPLCKVEFPALPPAPVGHKRNQKASAQAQAPHSSPINTMGLLAFQRLREYKTRHELEWDPEVLGKDPETGYFLSKKVRQRKICDQKANAVADLAAVLREVSEGKEGLGEVVVEWSDVLDAEYAGEWSDNVVHDTLEYAKNNRKYVIRRRFPVDAEGNELEADTEEIEPHLKRIGA